jgi:hypothetical protein
MGVPIIEAGKLLGVHRATLHRWLKNGLITKDPETGLVELGQIVKKLDERTGGKKGARGRPAGSAYKGARLSKVGDLGATLERAVVVLSDILGALSPSQREWVKTAIVKRVGDPKLLTKVVLPVEAAEMAIVETQQEQSWNNELVRKTLSAKVNTHAPDILVWGEKMKMRGIYEKAGLPVPQELLTALALITASPKLPDEPKSAPYPQNRA